MKPLIDEASVTTYKDEVSCPSYTSGKMATVERNVVRREQSVPTERKRQETQTGVVRAFHGE